MGNLTNTTSATWSRFTSPVISHSLLIWYENGMWASSLQTHYPSLMNKTSDKPQFKDIYKTPGPNSPKTIRFLENKENLEIGKMGKLSATRWMRSEDLVASMLTIADNAELYNWNLLGVLSYTHKKNILKNLSYPIYEKWK